jgi:hypothetical protein
VVPIGGAHPFGSGHSGPPLAYLNNSVREIGFLVGAIMAEDPVVRREPVDPGN